jgi:hypothetical protein
MHPTCSSATSTVDHDTIMMTMQIWENQEDPRWTELICSCVQNRGLVENIETQGQGRWQKTKPYVHLKANCQKWGFVPQSSHSAHTITLQSQWKIPSRSNLPYAKQTRSNYSILPCIIIIHNAYRPSICSYQHSRCVSQLLSYVCKTSSITSVAILGVSNIIQVNLTSLLNQ